ncbi:MAG: hypothetical protein E7311_05305 [Clostridiales bacterium]|nr:hypothetical protein [Clostridiales bacterium]
MGAFFTALGTVLGQNIATLISIALAGTGAYCLVSERGRLIVKSAFNWMFSTTANNPRLAAGAFDEKIKELRGKLRKAEDINQKALGELAEWNEKHEIARKSFEKYSEQAVILEKRGEHDKAILLAKQASEQKELMRNCQENIPSYEAAAQATKKRVDEIQGLIGEAKKKKEIVISNLEKGKFEKEVAEQLKGLEVSSIDSYLKQIEDNATDKKYQAIGARMSYETSEVKQLRDAQEAATQVDAEAFLQQLLNESNK